MLDRSDHPGGGGLVQAIGPDERLQEAAPGVSEVSLRLESRIEIP